MDRYEISLEIDSKGDADAIRRLLRKAHDTMREEFRGVNGQDDTTRFVAEFETLREAARDPMPGRLTITYEQYDEAFEE